MGDHSRRGNKRMGDNQMRVNQREYNNTTVEGCIINKTGRNVIFPSGSSQKYCSHFAEIGKF